ncbi:MAG: hypothetical protein HY899_09300 [Deltaproteobacteria bacterium]|nr:hypothetical protein [Deltaproteobacteria bacterium]
MNKVILWLPAIALVAAFAGAASAQCEFNSLAKAKGIKTSMVRVFAGCPSTEHASINSETGGGTPACAPVTVKQVDGEGTSYAFDPQTGGCDVQTRAKLEKDCSLLKDNNGDQIGLPAGPCHVTYIKAKCKGILQSEGGAPINATQDAGWSLAILTRATFDDATNGDLTVIDFPLSFAYGDPNNGQIKIDTSTVEPMASIWIDPPPPMPTCTTLHTIKITIKDPDGLPFATIGGSTRAKDE